jgi:hypothetical protein
LLDWERARIALMVSSSSSLRTGVGTAACDYRPLGGLAECQQLFPEFEPVAL